MIRGAVVLAVGFSLGYAKAMHEQDDIRAGVTTAIDLLKEAVNSVVIDNAPETENADEGDPQT